jgi:hypothetical protein
LEELQKIGEGPASSTAKCVHLDIDGAWGGELPGAARIDATGWGPKLRFTAPRRAMEDFYREVGPQLGEFTVSGSGDFHHLTALFLRRMTEPFLLVCFDNHPDWDVRPPHWACGGWLNRALNLPGLRSAAVWGCGNNELAWPNRIFGNRSAIRSGRLRLFAWQERYAPYESDPWAYISRAGWRDSFEIFTAGHTGERVYVTIDLDCLDPAEAGTNWEHGLFKADDLAWALARIRANCRLIGGDVCGAYSVPKFARWTQAFASKFDHPRLGPLDGAECLRKNRAALGKIWPALTG